MVGDIIDYTISMIIFIRAGVHTRAHCYVTKQSVGATICLVLGQPRSVGVRLALMYQHVHFGMLLSFVS